MNVHADLSFVTLISQASVVVQAVIALLVLLSLWSWWQIFLKMFQLRRATRDTDRFEDEFWKGGDLADLYQRTAQARTGGGMEHIFTAGFREFAKHRKQGSASAVTLDSARRAMRAAYQREIDALEANLSGLATVGSVSPYIGLFGTVWGIMNAFRGLSNVSAGHARERRARHRRGAGRHGDRPVRRDSRRSSATTATRTTSTGWRRATRRSSRSSRTSCSGRAEDGFHRRRRDAEKIVPT